MAFNMDVGNRTTTFEPGDSVLSIAPFASVSLASAGSRSFTWRDLVWQSRLPHRAGIATPPETGKSRELIQ